MRLSLSGALDARKKKDDVDFTARVTSVMMKVVVDWYMWIYFNKLFCSAALDYIVRCFNLYCSAALNYCSAALNYIVQLF